MAFVHIVFTHRNIYVTLTPWLRKLCLCLLYRILRIYARVLLSKFWYNWVFLRRGIEIVPSDSLTNGALKIYAIEVTSASNSRHCCSYISRPYTSAVSRPYSSSIIRSYTFFVSTPYPFTISSSWYSYQERSYYFSISTLCYFSISTPSSFFVSSPYWIPLAGLTVTTY